MFATIKNSFKVKEIRGKILFTLFVLIVYRLGSFITVPGVNAAALQEISSTGLASILNTFSGGGLQNYSLFAMGVSPYITAQIVVQLLQMDIVPKFVEWSKQGEVGRRKLNQATRWLTIVLGFVQSIGITAGFNSLSTLKLVENPSTQTYLTIGLILTAGTMLATWMGDMITERGLGNGVSMLIFAGIIAQMPTAIKQLWDDQIAGASGTDLWIGIGFVVLVAVAILIVVTFVTWVQQAERRLPIQYTRRTTVAPESSYLPLKINVAGVIPVIFAGSFISTPQTILMAFQQNHSGDGWYQVMTNIFSMQTTAGSSLYILLIVVFTFFYAFVQVNPEKLSESLQKQGSYIPGVWPGKGTQDYISSLLMRLSTMGALFLGFVSLIPLVASNVWNLSQSIGLGGTSLLIVVQIALDVIKQLNGLMMKREYIGFIHD
ncbi:preprotein translocase, SecY subunit [Paucilactobacillus oligofermentans DSM 15707 = LMG 22743]|uniref:Protein translocase subunit SecY n=1 Tax=Paucilactobacillus oligofermentans DSM 15707 = LMG 22743 TaxID=1423778 RepID=A0A0R1RDU8_9LACO|nr:preprotein translocase subunit SecY [Paucilactobacillus oligofermentans]KRL55197.1 preprotein translocase, SecY subunit [Paucilactobacillus oligofermentans DSM 15707 = LMG 22743]CUS25813.1 Preprotein translocase chain homolog SecY1 [Paucilactobacillus oligofermentans DSM 15707 = LMG 22743]